METNSTTDYYVWLEKEKQVVQVPRSVNGTNNHQIMKGKYCYRNGVHIDHFGMWREYNPVDGNCLGWQAVPVIGVPKEFLASLLLLGIQV